MHSLGTRHASNATGVMLVALGALCGVLAVLAGMAASSRRAAVPLTGQTEWSEIAWPIPRFRGRRVARTRAQVQAKIGFCNCATGVADDEELERVGELLLVGRGATPTKPGRPIAVGVMKGRSRPYALNGATAVVAPSGPLSALLIAYNDRCDVVVATALSSAAGAADMEPHVLGFLGSDTIMPSANSGCRTPQHRCKSRVKSPRNADRRC